VRDPFCRLLAGTTVAALALGLKSRDLRAEPEQFALSWSGVSGCPTESEVRTRIVRVLGERSSSRESIAARITVSVDGDTYRASVVLTSKGQSIERPIEGDSCSAVADATALIVALAIDPEALEVKAATKSTNDGVLPAAVPLPSTPPPVAPLPN